MRRSSGAPISGKTTGRIIGAALLVQVAVAPPVYFLILPRLTAPGAMAGASAHAFPVRSALLTGLMLAAMSLLAAIMALPIVRRHSERMAFAYVALAAAGIATMAMETLAARGMLAVSLEMANAGAPVELLGTPGARWLARSGAPPTTRTWSSRTARCCCSGSSSSASR